MKVRFVRLAEDDLDQILAWIAQDDPHRAISFIETLERRCASLADHPLRFPEVRTIGRRAVRKLTHKGYLIFYIVGAEEVEIARVVHGSRDWAAIFGEEDGAQAER